MNIRNEIPNLNQLSNNISVYPNPPSYYKRFVDSPQAMTPPNLNIFTKINTFGCLGFEYKINNYNFYTIDLDPSIRINDEKFVKDKQIPNVSLFNENVEVVKNKISQMTIIEQVDIIKEEVKFLNRIYTDLTKKLNFNFRDSEIDNKLMKFAFQKIYFVISIIKRKQIFAETLKFFKNEIEQINYLDRNMNENLDTAYKSLSENIQELKKDLNLDS